MRPLTPFTNSQHYKKHNNRNTFQSKSGYLRGQVLCHAKKKDTPYKSILNRKQSTNYNNQYKPLARTYQIMDKSQYVNELTTMHTKNTQLIYTQNKINC